MNDDQDQSPVCIHDRYGIAAWRHYEDGGAYVVLSAAEGLLPAWWLQALEGLPDGLPVGLLGRPETPDTWDDTDAGHACPLVAWWRGTLAALPRFTTLHPDNFPEFVPDDGHAVEAMD